MLRRRVKFGIGLFGLAGAVVVAPGLDVSLPFASQRMYVLGLAVLIGSLLYVRPTRNATEPSPPVPERPADRPVPGESVEGQLETLSRNPLRPNAKRNWKRTLDDLKTHLRTLTVGTLTDRYNLNESEAEAMVDSGTWTDDEYAVAFFTGSYSEQEPSLIQLRRNTGQSQVGTQAKHVIDELGEIERGERLLPENALGESGGERSDDRAADQSDDDSQWAGESA